LNCWRNLRGIVAFLRAIAPERATAQKEESVEGAYIHTALQIFSSHHAKRLQGKWAPNAKLFQGSVVPMPSFSKECLGGFDGFQ
jgi:hypothetical protein